MEKEADRSGSAPVSAALTQSNAEPNMRELPDNIRVPLHELQADMRYLFGRVAAASSCANMMAERVLKKLAAIEVALAQSDAEPDAAVRMFANRFAPPRPDVSAGPNYVPAGGAGNGA